MSNDAEISDWLTRVGSATATGHDVISANWAATPLGSPDGWEPELRLAVKVCLSTRFPMLVMWGPELRMIYNDGYRAMIGDKHPAAMGLPFLEVWAEIADVIGPLTEHVVERNQPTWSEHQFLLMDRRGFPEETYFTFSYSPLTNADDEVVGVIDIATETTAQVVLERRLLGLGRLAEALSETAQVTDVCVAATAELSRWDRDIRSAQVFLDVEDEPLLIASTRRTPGERTDRTMLRDLIDTGEPRQFGLPGRAEGGPIAAIALPLGGERGGPRGALFVQPSLSLPFDALYDAFLASVAHAVSAALESAFRRSIEVGEQRLISDTLQAAMLRPANDHPTVAARYQPSALNLAVGGDWYDVIDLDEHRRALVVGDCVGHGLAAATAMGQLRSAARALLVGGHGPAAALEQLDNFAVTTPGAFAATVACAVIDRAAATITYSRAGHVPPVLVDDGHSLLLEDGGGPPLEIAAAGSRRESIVGYRAGAVLVLYSDGLIERRGETLDVGIARLQQLAAGLVAEDVHDIADQLLVELESDDHDDDIVLVVKRLHIDT